MLFKLFKSEYFLLWISSKLQSGAAHKPCETRVELGLWEQITDVPAPDQRELRPADRLTPATPSSEGERCHLKGNDVMPDFPLYWFWKASKLAIPYHSGWGKNSSSWDFFVGFLWKWIQVPCSFDVVGTFPSPVLQKEPGTSIMHGLLKDLFFFPAPPLPKEKLSSHAYFCIRSLLISLTGWARWCMPAVVAFRRLGPEIMSLRSAGALWWESVLKIDLPQWKQGKENLPKKVTFGWLCFYLQDGGMYHAESVLLERLFGLL